MVFANSDSEVCIDKFSIHLETYTYSNHCMVIF